MRLVGLTPADYSIDRLSTVLNQIYSATSFIFFTVKKDAVMQVLTAESSNYRLQLSLTFST